MFNGTRVLVVEDEALVAMMIEDFLCEIDCIVAATASRLNEAVKEAHRTTVDVALLDINLAGEQSYPVAKILLSRGTPCLFLTGYAVSELPAELQGTPVLNKPFTLDQLARALSAIGVNRTDA